MTAINKYQGNERRLRSSFVCKESLFFCLWVTPTVDARSRGTDTARETASTRSVRASSDTAGVPRVHPRSRWIPSIDSIRFQFVWDFNLSCLRLKKK